MIDEGFLIHAQSVDVKLTAAGQKLSRVVLWLRTRKGVSCLHIDSEQPTFFIPEHQKLQVEHVLRRFSSNIEYKPITLKSFNQETMLAVYCCNLKSYQDVRQALRAVNIETFESDFRLHERFLMERFCYGSLAFAAESSTDFANYRLHSDVRIKPSQYQPKLKRLSLDIECSAKGELFSVGLYAQDYKKVLMIGRAEINAASYIKWIADEKSLLLSLVEEINHHDPDVIIGWNVINFDFRLLTKRAAKYKLMLNLGRDGSAVHWRNSRIDVNDGFISIAGRVVVDGIDALKAETYNFSSFSLENVAQELLGVGKNSDDVDNRLAEIESNFKHNKQALAAYNLQDCALVEDIFEKTKVLDFLVFRSKLTGLPLDKRGGSVAAFTNLYLPKLHRAGYVAPNLPAGGGLASPGGYVMSSKPGIYKNVLVLDFKSLYPSIIRTFKIDPLGLIEGLRAEDKETVIPGFKGAYFSRDKHFLPDLIQQLWQERDLAKRAGDKAKSNAIKIIMNSFYGVLGSGGCRFYDARLASSITMRGHEIMQQTANWIEELGYQVIYGDTDSTFVLLDAESNALQCENIAKALVKEINQNWAYKIKHELNLDCYLELEFETHYSRFLMPTIRGLKTGSKKRYAGLVIKDGKEQLVFKGLETVRTDWTPLAKKFQRQLFDDVFHDKDPSEYIRHTVFATIQGHYDDLLIYRKRLRRPLREYKKNLPPHVKAALKADMLNEQQGNSLRYQNKAWIEYVMTLNGAETIEHQKSAIDYEHYVIKQLQPIADAILPFIGLSFGKIFKQQMSLFE